MGREVLEVIVEVSIAAIHANREALDTTPELKAETAQLLRQQERFLAWVRRVPNPQVYVAVYPLSEYVVDETPHGEQEDAENDGPVTSSG